MNSLLSNSLPDPSDFPPLTVAPRLRSLDAALRCTICGELFDAPVTTSCGHCFCSCCVRSAMSEKQECPACRMVSNEGHLRPNPAMEEVVTAWKFSRKYLLKLSKSDEKRSKLSSVGEKSGNNEMEIIVDVDQFSPKSKHNTVTNRGDTPVPTSDGDEEASTSKLALRADELISCPMCSKTLKYMNINGHLDRGCRDAPDSKPSEWNSLLTTRKTGKRKAISESKDNSPLPKASYATLKDKQLKDMLLEHNLSTTGDRNHWIQRHQRWVMIYNANLDRLETLRKSATELRRELRQWEETKSKKRKITVEDTLAHQKRHKDEFERLVATARGSLKPPSVIVEGSSCHRD